MLFHRHKLEEIYDVVIIDEASQMKPEFSIPAIARAKQAVIVGDEKQLPTTVFQAKTSEDSNDEDYQMVNIRYG